MYQQTVQRFKISLRETFPNLMSLRVMEKYDKTVILQISAGLPTLLHIMKRILVSGSQCTKKQSKDFRYH